MCGLVSVTVTRDEYGVAHEGHDSRPVMCNVRTMGNAAYYAAAAAGVHPEAVLEVRKAEYGGETLVDYQGRRLSVDRADLSSPDFAVLTLVERTSERGSDE